MLPKLAINAVVMMASSLWLFTAASPQVSAHVAFALGVGPLILAAIAYFVPVLTRGGGAPGWLAIVPLAAWLGGVVMIAGFSGALSLVAASHVAVLLAETAVVILLVWTLRRGKATLGKPHPGLDWYLAALVFLCVALATVPLMALWPEQHFALRLIHLHANLLGFVGLTAIGTLQVLLPTALNRPDPTASLRLSADFKFAVAGIALISLGAAWSRPLALVGALLLLIPLLRMGRHWAGAFFAQIARLHGAAASLALATIGLIGLVFAGIGHAYGLLSGRAAVAGFVISFLLPLVSGAANQLLPVWLRPGRQDAWHDNLRNSLGRYSGLRAALLVAGGFAVAFGWNEGLWLAAAGLMMFAGALLSSLRMNGKI